MRIVSKVQQENAHASAVRGLQAQIVLPLSFVGMRAPPHAASSVTGGHQQQQQLQQLAQVWTLGHDQRVCKWLLLLQQAGTVGDTEPVLHLSLQQQSSWQTEVPEPSALSVLCLAGSHAAALMTPCVGHSHVPAAAGGAFVVVVGRGLQLAAAAL